MEGEYARQNAVIRQVSRTHSPSIRATPKRRAALRYRSFAQQLEDPRPGQRPAKFTRTTARSMQMKENVSLCHDSAQRKTVGGLPMAGFLRDMQ
jgi:hypothetical protein